MHTHPPLTKDKLPDTNVNRKKSACIKYGRQVWVGGLILNDAFFKFFVLLRLYFGECSEKCIAGFWFGDVKESCFFLGVLREITYKEGTERN